MFLSSSQLSIGSGAFFIVSLVITAIIWHTLGWPFGLILLILSLGTLLLLIGATSILASFESLHDSLEPDSNEKPSITKSYSYYDQKS